MTTDLDTRLTTALTDAASSTTVDDDALTAIVQRSDSLQTEHRPARWIAAGGITAVAAITAAALIVNSDQGSAPPTLAVIQMPSLASPIEDCGTVDQRPANSVETARVAYLPDTLPAGYTPTDPQPAASVQERPASTVDCWSADATYLDTTTGRLLSAAVSRQGNDYQAGCQLPDGYLPAECITIGDRPAGLTHEGTRATIAWVTADNEFASVSGYRFTTDELVAAATGLAFDGTNVSLTPPTTMTQVENTPKTRSDDRDITYYSATFTNGSDTATEIRLSVTTWNDTSINEVGPATTVDINGTTAIVVTTGGPGTGITGWTNKPDGNDPVADIIPFDQPAHAYITWNDNGLTFRLEGPGANALTQIAQHLRPA